MPADAAASYFPNNVLITQDNQKVKFYDDLLKDRFVVINFMFTTCTSVCPPMTANLKRLQTLLGERSKDVNLISISVDPQTDTPERLKDYANKFKVQPGWYFLTGDKADVEAVLKKLGGYVANKNDHGIVLLAGNVPSGEWKKLYALSKATDLSSQIKQLLDSRSK
jgi:protein SCO1/2